MSLTNGHVDVVHDNHINSALPLTRSESELSDLNDAPPSRTEAHDHPASEDDAIHDMATSEMDEDEDAPGEEDAEYDAESPAPEPAGGMRHDRSSSEDSLRPARRKGDGDDDEFMKQNPELYGLRRSVSVSYPARLHSPR